MKRRLISQWLPLGLLTLAVLSLFWPVILNPFLILHPTFSLFSDTMVIHWPKAHLMAQSWRAGEGIPHWTPQILSGMPLAANQLAMLYYPLAWLFFVFPLEPTFNLLFIFHLLLGGWGIYFLLREAFAVSASAALLGGLTFALNGKLLAHTAGGHVSMVGAVAWMVWGIFGLQMILQRRCKNGDTRLLNFVDLKWTGLVAIALAMQIVTHTLPLIYSIYLMGAMVIWHFILIQNKNGWSAILQESRRLVVPFVSIPLAAALLSVGQLLALLELTPFSNRALSLEQAAEYAVTPAQLFVGLLLPSAQGGHELVIYLGLIPLLLIPFGLTRRHRWSWFYGAVFIFAILFALGPSTPLHSLFYQFAPGFRWVRTPARIFFVGAIAASILVGFAIDRLAANEWLTKTQQQLTLLFVGFGASALLVGLGLVFGFGQLGRAAIGLAIFIPAALAVLVLRIKQTISSKVAISLLGLLLFFDLASFDTSMMRFVPLDEALAPGKSVADYLAQKPGKFRIYSPSYSLPMQTAAAHNLELADGVEPVHLAVYDQFMARAGGYNNPSFSVTIPNFGEGSLDSALKDVEPDLKLLGLLNVQYIASAFPMEWSELTLETQIDETYIYANNQALPRAWVAHQTVPTADDWLAQLEEMPNLRNVVTTEDGPHLTESKSPASAVKITHFSADVIKLETVIEEPGWLVMSELWYPGWEATVNGSAEPVKKVNGLLRGVYLKDSGMFKVTLNYK